MIADLRIADELQLGIVQPKFVHDINGMSQITTNPVTNDTQFHGLTFLFGKILSREREREDSPLAHRAREAGATPLVPKFLSVCTMQLGANVRMDLFYGSWSARQKAWVDAFTVLFLLFYLSVLLWGALVSTSYALGDFRGEPFSFFWGIIAAFFTGGPDAASEAMGHLERSSSVWRPYLWPIKTVMVIGVTLMLLQALSELFKDIFLIRGVKTP